MPKNCPKSVQNRQKRGLFIKNGKYRFKIWFIHSFHYKIQFKGLFKIIFFRNIQLKKYSIIFFPGKFNSKIYSKILIWLDSIQYNIHSIRKAGYRPPLHRILWKPSLWLGRSDWPGLVNYRLKYGAAMPNYLQPKMAHFQMVWAVKMR